MGVCVCFCVCFMASVFKSIALLSAVPSLLQDLEVTKKELQAGSEAKVRTC